MTEWQRIMDHLIAAESIILGVIPDTERQRLTEHFVAMATDMGVAILTDTALADEDDYFASA